MTVTSSPPATTLLPAGWELHRIDDARGALNAAWTAIATDPRGPERGDDTLMPVREARRALEAVLEHDGVHDARLAAHEALPLVTRAEELLLQLGREVRGEDVAVLTRDFGAAMDRLEQALAAAGWD